MVDHLSKVLEQNQVCPPPGSVPSTSLPLTFFDIPFLLCAPVQRLYLYEFPHPTHHFIQTILPNLKHSLSPSLSNTFFLSLQISYALHPQPNPTSSTPTATPSLSPSLSPPPISTTLLPPMITPWRFKHYTLLSPICRRRHVWVTRVGNNNDTRVVPLMALQVSVFPNLGVCIGVTFNHVVADGRAFHHFMKSWASICRTRRGEDLIRSIDMPLLPPFHDRAVVDDPDGLELIYLEWWKWASTWTDNYQNKQLAGTVRATFVMGQTQIERLKCWVKNQCTSSNNLEPLHSTSTFVVTSALIWVCLVKSQEFGESNNSMTTSGGDKPCYFIYFADCRNRFGFPLIPRTYFGNCLALCYVSVKRSELLGFNGIVAAAKAIGNRVRELESSGAVKGAEKWMLDAKQVVELWDYVFVSGSPRLGVYETHFGWGKPRKSEIVHINVGHAISLTENREEKDGIGVGLALSKAMMECFKAILEESLSLVDI